jgi:hypothetical protein
MNMNNDEVEVSSDYKILSLWTVNTSEPLPLWTAYYELSGNVWKIRGVYPVIGVFSVNSRFVKYSSI